MIDPEIIASLKNTRGWAALEQHIQQSIDALDRLPSTKGKDDRAVAIEVAARGQAIETLRAIIAPFVDFKGVANTNQARTDKVKDAGLA